MQARGTDCLKFQQQLEGLIKFSKNVLIIDYVDNIKRHDPWETEKMVKKKKKHNRRYLLMKRSGHVPQFVSQVVRR